MWAMELSEIIVCGRQVYRGAFVEKQSILLSRAATCANLLQRSDLTGCTESSILGVAVWRARWLVPRSERPPQPLQGDIRVERLLSKGCAGVLMDSETAKHLRSLVGTPGRSRRRAIFSPSAALRPDLFQSAMFVKKSGSASRLYACQKRKKPLPTVIVPFGLRDSRTCSSLTRCTGWPAEPDGLQTRAAWTMHHLDHQVYD